ncbi:MAG: efflux RND transporter periplasmic adaptor subunit [Phycisphaerae bacterium]|nr:efflux RND transporter periplasmic adaptor subunit [Phycisphaerae bacterium]
MYRVALILVLALSIVGLLLLNQQHGPEFHVSGVIEADDVRVGSRVGGRVANVHVSEGQKVRAGESLITLEPYDLLAQRAQAEAIVAARREQLLKSQNGPRPEEIAAAQAERGRVAAVLARLEAGLRPLEIEVLVDRLAVAQAELQNANTNYERVAGLRRSGAAAAQEWEDVSDRLSAAKARHSLAEHELALAREGTRAEQLAEARAALAAAEANSLMLERGYRAEDIAAAAAELAAAEGALASIDRRLDELTVGAPLDSVVDALELQPGDLIAPNAPMITLVSTARLYVRSYVPENRLDIRVGRPVRVVVDAYPGRSFEGRITFVARTAEFTPSNVQTVEERVKLVFRIKVEVITPGAELRPGMIADVYFDLPTTTATSAPAATP